MPSLPPIDPSAVAAARLLAGAAAAGSGVRIEPVEDIVDLAGFGRTVEEIWRPAPTDPPVTLALLRALAHSGGYCTMAFDGDRPVGVCLGWIALRPVLSVHSHIAGVTAIGLGRQIGFALKLDQRAWALERGLDTITWTYDPLVRRNAYFNAGKLGATPIAYLVDFYGEMDDLINAGQGSDRLLTAWPLLDPAVVAACAGTPVLVEVDALLAAGACVVLDEDGAGPSAASEPTSPVALVRVPRDIEALRRHDPAAGVHWRAAVRATMGKMMADGWTVTGAARAGWYVLGQGGRS